MDLDVRRYMGQLDQFRAAGEKCVSAFTQALSTTSSQILVLIACLVLAWITSKWGEKQALSQIQERNFPSHFLLVTLLQQSGYSELNELQVTKLDLKRHFPLIGEKSPLFWRTENQDWIASLSPLSENSLREMHFFTRLSHPDLKSPTAEQWNAIQPSAFQLQWNGFIEALVQSSPGLLEAKSCKSPQKPLDTVRNGFWRHPRELKY